MLNYNLWLLSILSSTVSAAVFNVSVGANGNNFQPSTITAQVGDFVTFNFNNVLHDVAQSSANAPCSYSSGTPAGFYSTQQSRTDASFTIAVTDTQPKYFFCSVSNHCNVGMVGIINPGNVTQSDFARNARSAQVSAPRGSAHVGGNLTIGSTTTPGVSNGTTTTGNGNSSSGSGTGSSNPAATSSTRTSDAMRRVPVLDGGLLMAAFLLFACL